MLPWSEWVLIYLAIGVLVILMRAIQTRMLRDATDVLSCVAFWPITLVSYPVYKYSSWKRERARQAHITQNVRDGKYTAEWAHEHMTWKEPKGGV